MSKVKVMDHPLIQHKIGVIRRKDTCSKDFRTIISEIAMLMCYEATRELKLTDVEIETPICTATVKELQGKKLAVVPILRAGLGMVDGGFPSFRLQRSVISVCTVIPKHWSRWNITANCRQILKSVKFLS